MTVSGVLPLTSSQFNSAAARKLMTTVSASASAGQEDDVESMEKVSTGGSADTEITGPVAF